MNAGGEPQRNRFDGVARIIARGEPPEWLVPELAQYSWVVSSTFQITPEMYRQCKKRIKRMQEAVDTVLEGLPIFGHLYSEWDLNEYEPELSQLKDYFDRLSRMGKGRRAHLGREFCASLIISWWSRIHGKAARRSDKAYLACEEYWRACGNEPSGDIENW